MDFATGFRLRRTPVSGIILLCEPSANINPLGDSRKSILRRLIYKALLGMLLQPVRSTGMKIGGAPCQAFSYALQPVRSTGMKIVCNAIKAMGKSDCNPCVVRG